MNMFPQQRLVAGLAVVGALIASLPAKAAHDVSFPTPPHPEVYRGERKTVTLEQIRQDLDATSMVNIRFDDQRYVRLEHDYLPKLLDWHHALRAEFAHIRSNAEINPRRYNERAAHVMRVMLSLSARKDAGYGDAALLIGNVRLIAPGHWAKDQAGEAIDLILVGTEKGYFLIDPSTRTLHEFDEALRAATVWLHL